MITPPTWAIGQRIRAAVLNVISAAIAELQAETWSVPYLLMRNTAAVTAAAVVPYNTLVTDTHNAWDATNKRYVVPRSGDYLAITQAMANAAAACGPNIRVNGTTRIGAGTVTALNGESGTVLGVIQVVAGDLVDVLEGSASYTPHSASRNFLILKYWGPS